MLLGYLNNLQQEITMYPQSVQKGLKFLLQMNVADVAIGRYEIQGDAIFAMVSEYHTEPKANRRPEAHSKYLDIQYICLGSELIGVAPLALVGEISEDKSAEKDIIYYKGVEMETDVTLCAGMFAVYFPWDAHRPNCNVDDTSQKVKKIVVKIALDTIL